LALGAQSRQLEPRFRSEHLRDPAGSSPRAGWSEKSATLRECSGATVPHGAAVLRQAKAAQAIKVAHAMERT
jgi:hypothetical protein